MADKTIGELPSISQVQDSSLIPVEQGGAAGKMTGAQFKNWAIASAAGIVEQAQAAASAASGSATDAGNSATNAANSADSAASSAVNAESAKEAIVNMGVAATTLDPGSTATVSKTVSQGVVTLTYGIPRGNVGPQGETGPRGLQGVQGPKGDTGTSVAVATDGAYRFYVDNDSESQTYGHLFIVYSGEDVPAFSIPTSGQYAGHLIWTVEE